MKKMVYDLDSGKQSNISYQRDDTKSALILFCILGLAFFLFTGVIAVKECNKPVENSEYTVVNNKKIGYNTICPKCKERIIKVDNPSCLSCFKATVVVDKYGLEYDAACGLELISEYEQSNIEDNLDNQLPKEEGK